MTPDVPSLWAAKDAPDDEREQALALQASLPSDLVNPSDALGEEQWNAALQEDFMANGENALAKFQSTWDWGLPLQQRAAALADVALQREMTAFIDGASGLAVKPPVDPEEFALAIREHRLTRARRT